MLGTDDGSIVLLDGFAANRLTLNAWLGGAWRPLALTASADTFVASQTGVRAELRCVEEADSVSYELSFNSASPTRLQLCLAVREAANPFHLIPASIFGDNNLTFAEPGHFPNLTGQHPGSISCSTYWELRADRAALPVSMLCFDGGVAAVSIDPYTQCPLADTTSREGFLRNGVFARLARGPRPHACGVTLGYRNTPVSFINKDQWGTPTEHRAVRGSSQGRIFLRKAGSRRDAHEIIRSVYGDMRATPENPIARREAARSLVDAFLTVNWQPDKENFSNMRFFDPNDRVLRPWRTLAEVGWTGGGVIGYPLLVAGHVLGNDLAVQRAHYMLDWAADAYNPASGLLWEVHGKHEGTQIDWWWSGYTVQGVHCAYTNGSAVYYLLKAYEFARDAMGAEEATWLKTSCKVLDTVVALQAEDGNFGYTYSTERPEMLDAEGFAGVYFVAALALAYRLTGQGRYLDAARKGIAYYHSFVKELNCWGTPMDTWKSLDQEGNLGFMRAAFLLHQVTGDDAYLGMLEDGANYEYLWRYGFRARPEYPPLKGSYWNSCGGSVTSVSNPHIHPMGVFVSTELKHLADETDDSYHCRRWEDGINWAINTVSLYPEVTGYGIQGVLTERFCPSDGLTIETYPDGTPASIWFSYNGWAAAAVLEGLAEQLVSGS